MGSVIPFCSDIQSDEPVSPPEGTDVSATDELQVKVGELEAKVKDLDRKVADLFMDNVALKTKLEASRKVEKQQQEEITSLKERLVQALRTQVNMHFCHMQGLELLSTFLCSHNRKLPLKRSHCQRLGKRICRPRLNCWKKQNLTWRQKLSNLKSK